MTVRIASLLAVACVTALAACSGGGGPAPRSNPQVTQATPTAPPAGTVATQQIHYITLLGGTRSIVVSPAGAPLPSGFVDAGPVASAVVTFPDGSTQIADANGGFAPERAGYARANASILESNSDAQPGLKVQDPAARANAIDVTVPAFGAAGGTPVLAGVRTLPEAAEVFAGDTLLVSVEAVDTTDRSVGLGSASITWSAASGSIAPIAGTDAALYTAPVGGAPIVDTVTASVRSPGRTLALVATTPVRTLPKSSAFTIRGSLASASGAPLANGVALFTDQSSPRAAGSYNFFGIADASGAYAAAVAPNANFFASIGVASAAPPVGYFATGQTVASGAAGGSTTANLTVPASSPVFDDQKDEAQRAISPPIASVRDAWAAAATTTVAAPWAADSGLATVLASVPTTFPSPANPTALSSGLFTNWCYQWTNPGVPTLVVVENGDATCGSPGNLAFVVVPGATNAFGFRRYELPTGAFAIATPLDATARGSATLATGGIWTQALANGTDVRQVKVDAYGPLAPALGSPFATETFRYTYTAGGSGGGSTVAIDNDQTIDVATGRVVQTASVSARARASLDAGSNGCFAPGQPSVCYEASANVTRTVTTSAGAVVRILNATALLSGDGSDLRSVRASGGSDRTQIDLSFAPTATRVAGNCLVCASSNGQFDDSDGATDLGNLFVDGGGVARLTLLDTVPGGSPGAPFATLVFGT